ncbi:hypothetical protein [Mycolicibacterium sp.]|jgi:hypothetical protein|uniref:hypothetical protein n=1 Tax=Mycolicibacterium sp. TaxID=2320850 RepID=UPI0028A9031D|nr:hypothetical protein [Mycolicibacterium sp.]
MTVALAAAAGLTGCAEKKPADAAADSSASPSAATSSAGSQTPTDSSSAASPAPTTAPRTETWIALKPGDCLADPPPTDPAVVTVTLVDCSQPHMAEAFLRAPIPVDAALDTTANAECEAGFAQYTGRPSAGGPYIVGYLIDSAQDRTGNIPLPSTVICLLQGAQGQPLTGSAKA